VRDNEANLKANIIRFTIASLVAAGVMIIVGIAALVAGEGYEGNLPARIMLSGSMITFGVLGCVLSWVGLTRPSLVDELAETIPALFAQTDSVEFGPRGRRVQSLVAFIFFVGFTGFWALHLAGVIQ
jgi:hypothetical protein